jgi:hypothetical protein
MSEWLDKVNKNIVFILKNAASVGSEANRQRMSEEQFEVIVSEIALISLITADMLDEKQDASAVLVHGTAEQYLRQIASECLDIQETEDTGEIRRHLQAVDDLCDSVAKLMNVTMPEPHEEVETALMASLTADQAVETSITALLPSQDADDVKRLQAEIRALRELLTSLIMERDHLENVVLKDLDAAYMRELGGLEAEVIHAEYEARLLKRQLELMQACVNRDEPIVEETIWETLKQQAEEYKKKYDDYVRHVNEAKASEKAQQAAKDDRQIDVEQECKKIYRKLAKALHPDLNPNLSKEMQELFKKAIVAYKNLDLKTLR